MGLGAEMDKETEVKILFWPSLLGARDVLQSLGPRLSWDPKSPFSARVIKKSQALSPSKPLKQLHFLNSPQKIFSPSEVTLSASMLHYLLNKSYANIVKGLTLWLLAILRVLL